MVGVVVVTVVELSPKSHWYSDIVPSSQDPDASKFTRASPPERAFVVSSPAIENGDESWEKVRFLSISIVAKGEVGMQKLFVMVPEIV